MEQFADGAKMTIKLAQEEACRLSHNFVGTESILLGIIAQDTGIAALFLKSVGINLKNARIEVEKLIGRGSGSVVGNIPFTHRAAKVIDFSHKEARKLQSSYIDTEHLLLALINEGEGVCLRVLHNLGIDSARLKHQLLQEINNLQFQNTVENPVQNITQNPVQNTVQNTVQNVTKINLKPINSIVSLPRLTNLEDRIDHLNIILQEAQQLITEIINSRNQLYFPILPTSHNIDNIINYLPNSTSTEKINIKDLLKQLKSAIEADERLKLEDKAEALQQILVLAVAARNPTDKQMLSSARTAIKIIVGTVAQRPPSNQLVKECKRLLPIIVQFFKLR